MSRGIEKYLCFRNDYKNLTVIQPIMTGGMVSQEVQKKLFEEEWVRTGYTICFDCIKGRSDMISKPPIGAFLNDLADFFGGDQVQHTFGCRTAQFAVMKTISDFVREDSSKKFAPIVLADPLCHYSTAIAAEIVGLRITETQHTGYPEFKVEPEFYRVKLEEIKRETGKLPGLMMITHVEPYHGNVNPAEKVGEIAEEYNVPYMVNAAYTAGVMPVNMKNLCADFLTVSAHKSMASLAPLGYLVVRGKWTEKAFRVSKIITEGTGRIWSNKILNIFGCNIGGIPLISSMYAFPYVSERVGKWDLELKKTHWFIKEMEKIEGIRLIGERPHMHHLLHFETPIFWEISQNHKRRGFFLAEDMIKRGIVGLQRGLTKNIKLSVYGLGWEDLKKVRDGFYEIASKYVKEFKLKYNVP
ncbi:MAG: O-phospho-L-seryl-tRNA:Cys-tRNA synthase [Candidatus Jordarchaeaceae archaeon]